MIEQVIAEYADFAMSIKNDTTLGPPVKADILAKMATSLAALVPLVATGQDTAVQQQMAVEKHQQDLQMAQEKHQMEMAMNQQKHEQTLNTQQDNHQQDLQMAQMAQQTNNQPPNQ